MAESQQPFRHYLDVVRRRGWLIALTTALAIVTAGLISFVQDSTYRASMKIVVGQGGSVFQPEFGSAVEPFTQTMTNLLESDVVARGVIDDLRLSETPDELLEEVRVSTRPESSVLEVSYDSTSQEKAVAVLAELGTVFTTLVDERLRPRTGAGDAEAPALITASVFDPAHLEPDPVAPRTRWNLAIAGLLGLAVAFVLAFVREATDDRIRSRKEAEEAFRAPVIGALPKGIRGRPPFGVAGQAAPTQAHLIEALQLLRANLQFSSAGLSGPTILVTSALPEEGKSTVVANIGVILAMAGKDVICVEADMRRPRLQHYLGVRPKVFGLVDFVRGRAELESVLQDVELTKAPIGASASRPAAVASGSGGAAAVERWAPSEEQALPGRLRVLLTGIAPANPSEILTAEHVDRLMRSLRASADYVVFDTPPLLLVGDAFPIALAADNVIIVAREGRTTKETAEAVRATLEGLHVQGISVVLTDSDLRDGYGSGYGSYGYGADGNVRPGL